MPNWANSGRREELPKNWTQIRDRILRRDGHCCTYRNDYGERCHEPATDVDHIRPGSDHREHNLRSLCDYHHKQKSGAEGAAARAANRKRIAKRFRRNESHPGLL